MNSKDIQDFVHLKSVVDSIIEFYKQNVIDINNHFDILISGLQKNNEKLLIEYAKLQNINESDVDYRRTILQKGLENIVKGIEVNRDDVLKLARFDSTQLIQKAKTDAKENGVSKEVLDSVHGFQAQVIQLFPNKK